MGIQLEKLLKAKNKRQEKLQRKRFYQKADSNSKDMLSQAKHQLLLRMQKTQKQFLKPFLAISKRNNLRSKQSQSELQNKKSRMDI